MVDHTFYSWINVSLTDFFMFQVNLDHFINPEETYRYLLITAEMFGLLKQVKLATYFHR